MQHYDSVAERRELILALIVLIVGATAAAMTLRLPASPLEPLGPGALPLALGIALVILAIIQLARVAIAVRKRKAAVPAEPMTVGQDAAEGPSKSPQEAAEYVPRPELAILSASGLIVMTALIHLRVLGFRPAALVYVLFLSVILHWREKKFSRRAFWIAAIVMALAMSFGVHWVFTSVFNVRLR